MSAVVEIVTLESINAKLEQLLALMAAAGIAVPEKAYDRPQISAAQATVDGKTINVDGSIWAMQTYGPDAGNPVREFYGYISPKKRPDIWAAGLKLLGPERFAVWEAGWKTNPYGVYRADIGTELANGVANFMLFSYVYGQPATTYVQ